MVQYLSDEAFSELMLEQEVSSSSSIITVWLRFGQHTYAWLVALLQLSITSSVSEHWLASAA